MMPFAQIQRNLSGFLDNNQSIDEENTKAFLVLPFLAYLGYDIFSPDELAYEYECDIIKHGHRKVDFAILGRSKCLKIIIEAKALNESLDRHIGQIKQYLMSSKAEYGIITNGNRYIVYRRSQINADFGTSEVLPYGDFCISDLNEENMTAIKELSKFAVFSNEDLLKQSVIKESVKGLDEQIKDSEKMEEKEFVITHELPFLDKYLLHAEANDFIGHSLDKTYEEYALAAGQEETPKTQSIFMNKVKEFYHLSTKVCDSRTYFYEHGIEDCIFESFVASMSLDELDGKKCNVIYTKYKEFCNSGDYYSVKKNDFIERLSTLNDEYCVNNELIRGAYVKVFRKWRPNARTSENNPSVPNSVIEFLKQTPIGEIIDRKVGDVFEEYETFCQTNGYRIISKIAFSKYVIKQLNIQAVTRKIDGKCYRIYRHKD